MWACRALASLPPAAAPQGPCSRRALLQGRPSRTVRPLQRCPAADGEAEAATDAAAAGTTSLPPLKQVRCPVKSGQQFSNAERRCNAQRENHVQLCPFKRLRPTQHAPLSPTQMPYQAIATLAAVGVADTAYLSAVKLLHLTPACPLSGGCVDVLTSEYASLFGIVPLAFVGLAAYASMGALALTGARQAAAARAVAAETASSSSSSGGDDATSSRAEPEQDESPLRSAVLAGGLVMASTSSVLLYILFTHFPGDLCPWCLGSAALSFAIAATAASGLRQGEVEEAAAPGAGIVAATLLFMTVALGGVNDSAFASGGYDLDYALPAVTTSSPPKAVALAEVRATCFAVLG